MPKMFYWNEIRQPMLVLIFLGNRERCFQNSFLGASLVVQWLRICLPEQEIEVLIVQDSDPGLGTQKTSNLVFILQTETACLLSCLNHVRLFMILWTVARQAPLSMGFSRQEHWSGSACPSPGESSQRDQTHTSCSSCTAGFFTSETSREAQLRQHYAPLRQEVTRAIVVYFPVLILSRTLGFWSTASFCVPPFPVGRILASFSVFDPPWGPKRRFKWLPIREGRGYRNGEESSGGTALGRSPGSYWKDMQSNVFEFFGRTGVTSSNIAPSPHHPLTRRMSHTLEPSPQILHSFSGPGDNYVRPPVGPQSVSPLRVQEFQAELLLLWGWTLISSTEYLALDQAERRRLLLW